MKQVFAVAVFLLLMVQSSSAQGFIETPDGLLSDDDFYNVVECGVTPDQRCTAEPLKWSPQKAKNLRIKVIVKGTERGYQDLIKTALDQAIANINTVTPKLRLSRTSKARAEITLYITRLEAGGRISGTRSDLDGTDIEGAAVNIEWNDASHITRATIVMAGDLDPGEIPSIMLEELTQALGPINDIRNKAYEGVSIFSEDSNAQSSLGKQDIMVLRRLYQ